MLETAHRHLLVLVYLSSWTVLTAVGAGAALTPYGRHILSEIMDGLPPQVAASLGNADYLALLLTPYLLVPSSSVLAYYITSKALRGASLGEPAVSPASLFVLLAACAAYCFYKLTKTGNLFPATLFSGAEYKIMIEERARLVTDLRFAFYAILYAVLPMIAVMFFSNWLHLRRKIDLTGLLICFVIFYYLALTIYMKLPFVMFFAILALTIIVSNRGYLYLPVIVIATIATFLSLHMLLGGYGKTEPPGGYGKTEPLHEQEQPRSGSNLGTAATSAAVSVVFRMGSAFPYYVAMFENEDNRCGVETNQLPLLPSPACDIPTKVFAQMYPKITWVTGFAPAAAHVSAFGEIGLGYSLLILIVSGLSLGFLSALIATGRGTAFVALGAASCVYAYYLTQVPFLGALTFSHGLLFYGAPIIAALGLTKTIQCRRLDPLSATRNRLRY